MKTTTVEKGHDAVVIKELKAALDGGNAHATFEDAVKEVRHDLLGTVPDGLPYSIWQLVEHIRITQWDILEFSRNPKHVSPEWPAGYWPKEKAPEQVKDWAQSVDRISAERKEFIALLDRVGEGIYDPFPYGDGQSLFREAVLLVDHTSYHTGEIIVLRRLLKDWK
jgi:DinB superfamily